MKKVEAFETTDGKLFNQELDAKIHQAILNKGKFIDDFLASEYCPYKNPMPISIAKRVLVGWEAYLKEKK